MADLLTGLRKAARSTPPPVSVTQARTQIVDGAVAAIVASMPAMDRAMRQIGVEFPVWLATPDGVSFIENMRRHRLLA